MFETLFHYPAVLRRHRDGPLATERAAYLAALAARGHAPSTVRKCARYCLAIAVQLQTTPHAQPFTTADIDRLAGRWAAGRVAGRHAAGLRWPQMHFRAIATDFLKMLRRWTPPPVVVRLYATQVETIGAMNAGFVVLSLVVGLPNGDYATLSPRSTARPPRRSTARMAPAGVQRGWPVARRR
jgi:hypothetical protein